MSRATVSPIARGLRRLLGLGVTPSMLAIGQGLGLDTFEERRHYEIMERDARWRAENLNQAPLTAEQLSADWHLLNRYQRISHRMSVVEQAARPFSPLSDADVERTFGKKGNHEKEA